MGPTGNVGIANSERAFDLLPNLVHERERKLCSWPPIIRPLPKLVIGIHETKDCRIIATHATFDFLSSVRSTTASRAPFTTELTLPQRYPGR